MGIRIEQVDVLSLSKVFVTKKVIDDAIFNSVSECIEEGNGIRLEDKNVEEELRIKKVIHLKEASDSELGGIKLGKGLEKGEDGIVNVSVEQISIEAGTGIEVDSEEGTVTIKTKEASDSELGGIKLGKGLEKGDDGVVNVSVEQISIEAGDGIEVTPGEGNVTIKTKVASSSELGAIKIGRGLSIDPESHEVSTTVPNIEAGEAISLTSSEESVTIDVKPASGEQLGAIKIGRGLSIDPESHIVSTTVPNIEAGEAISLNPSEESITIDVKPASGEQLGVIKIGEGLHIDEESHVVSVVFPEPDDMVDEILDNVSEGIGGDNIIVEGNKLHAIKYEAGDGIEVNEGVDEKTKNIVLKKAAAGQLGGVKIGEGINVDGEGLISIPTKIATTEVLGAIKVGSNLSITPEGVLSADVSGEQISSLEEQVELILSQQQLIVNELDRIYEIITNMGVGSDIHVYGDNFISGTSIIEKVGTKIKFPRPLSNTDYKVVFSLSSNTNGSLGEVWIENKETDGFTLKSSGSLLRAQLDWLVFLSEEGTTEFSEEVFPYQRGEVNLNSTTGVDITFANPYSDTEYATFISPNTNHNGEYGEVWVEGKETSKCVAKSSGATTSGIDYIVAKYQSEDQLSSYDSDTYPILVGQANFDTEVSVPLDSERAANNYQVIITPEGSQGGLLGEYWVSEKRSSSFIVNTTGGTEGKFNYLVIGN